MLARDVRLDTMAHPFNERAVMEEKQLRVEIRLVGESGETIKALSEVLPATFPLASLLAAGEQLQGIRRLGRVMFSILPETRGEAAVRFTPLPASPC